MTRQQIRILTLELDKDGSSVVYKLQKEWILQFRLGTSLLGQNVTLHTNYPFKSGVFERSKYEVVQWQSDCNNQADDTSIYANIQVKTGGSFHFYLTNSK